MNEAGIFSILTDWLSSIVTALLMGLLAVVRWAYVRDTKKIDDDLQGIRADHHKLIGMVNEINATRPLRTELTDAMDEVRKEVSAEFAGLRGEFRSDINGLRIDMTTRLDTLIRLHSERKP